MTMMISTVDFLLTISICLFIEGERQRCVIILSFFFFVKNVRGGSEKAIKKKVVCGFPSVRCRRKGEGGKRE